MYTHFCTVLTILSLVVIVDASKNVKLSAGKLRGDGGRGSGDDNEDDDEDAEGSTEIDRESACMKVRDRLKKSKLTGAYIPQCTREGEYVPIQCTDGKMEECWCVDMVGQEVPGTKTLAPNKPNCSEIDRTNFMVVVTRRQTWPHFPTTITSVQTTRREAPTVGGVKARQDHTSKGNDDAGIDQGNSAQGHRSTSPSSDGWTYIKSRPTLLAAIIGGVAVGLLCAMLLILFVVYRFRKKDEGSYALDEPKNSPAVAYTKASDREFFA